SAQVSSGDLSNDLASIGMLQRRMKFPRVMVMIAEQNVLNASYWNAYSTSNSQAETTISAKLKEKGFNVVDSGTQRRQLNAQEALQAWNGDAAAAGHAGQKLGAEIVIVGQASSTEAANHIAGSDLLSVSTTITAKVVKTGTNEIITQGSSDATAAHINAVAAL